MNVASVTVSGVIQGLKLGFQRAGVTVASELTALVARTIVSASTAVRGSGNSCMRYRMCNVSYMVHIFTPNSEKQTAAIVCFIAHHETALSQTCLQGWVGTNQPMATRSATVANASGLFCGKSFGFRVAINAAWPSSAQAQKGSSPGSGEISLVEQTSMISASSLEQIDDGANQVAPDSRPPQNFIAI